jgi:hypothetical protein
MSDRKSVGSGLLPVFVAVVSITLGSTSARAQFEGPTPLKLVNGWTNAPFSTSIATAEQVSGIVQLRGAIATTGTNPEPFILIPELRPATDVYIPVDLCAATKGRLWIQPNGIVTVQAETVFSNAQCFTSLDGASFARTAADFRPLTLINGWTNAPFGTSDAAVREIAGIVHLKGAMATTGTNTEPFVLPTQYRPAANVYIPIDLCDATNGRLLIQPSGVVTVQAQASFSNAQCFTSLDGAWFVNAGAGFQPLSLINGWAEGPYGTANAQAGNAYGIVYFQGAIYSGTSAAPFVLPPSLTPVTNVYVPVDLCDGTNGRLNIQSNGTVTIQEEDGALGNAECFTSLDGVSFVQ